MASYKRGGVWLANLSPVVGSEQGRTRPVVIIQNDIGNRYSPVVIIAAIRTTRSQRAFPTDVWAQPSEGGLRNPSTVMLNQIRTIDKSRLIEYWGRLKPGTMKKVNEALKISLGLTPI